MCFNKKDLMRRFKVECFSWAMIQFSHYLRIVPYSAALAA
jgi:hypothetical protein